MCHVSMHSSKFYNYTAGSHSDPKKFKGLILSETINAISFRPVSVSKKYPASGNSSLGIASKPQFTYTKRIFSTKENFETIKPADPVNFTYCDWLLCNNIFLAVKK